MILSTTPLLALVLMFCSLFPPLFCAVITPHTQRERGKVIGRGVHIYIYIYMSVVEKKFESYFRDRLTFSNVDSRTSR